MTLTWMVNISIDIFGAPQTPLLVVTAVAAVLVVVLDRRLGWFGKGEGATIREKGALVSRAAGR